jgi:biopolymer transport protein ExbB
MRALSTAPGRIALYLFALIVVWGMLSQLDHWASRPAAAGESAPKAAGPAADDRPLKTTEAERRAEAALAEADKDKAPANAEASHPRTAVSPTVWDLYKKGGVLMYPITFLSVVVVGFGLERFLGLRRSVVAPRRLTRGLRKIASPQGCDPVLAKDLCDRNPSAAANVIRTMLAKIGRPEGEVEQAIAAANEREATRLYQNVRWLNMAMSVAPMLGLLGTVQGMIIVFMGASQLPIGANKTEYMAEGIYLKLVCTFAGLIVAIPAAVLSYLFEGRIQRLLSEVEDLALGLLPRVQRYEKRSQRRPELAEQPEAE